MATTATTKDISLEEVLAQIDSYGVRTKRMILNRLEEFFAERKRKEQEAKIEAKLRAAWAEVQEAKRTVKKLQPIEDLWKELEKEGAL